MSDWYEGNPSAPAHPDASTMSVTAHGGVAWNAAIVVSAPASIVCTAVVASNSVRRGRRSASAPPNGPTNAFGMNAAAATMPVQPA